MIKMINIDKEHMNVYEIAFQMMEPAFAFIKPLQTTTATASASATTAWSTLVLCW